MNNFGVIEVASTKTKNAPGWAYVPDVGPSPSAAALQPANRKRARNQTVLSASDLSARQEAKIRKDLEALDRDIHKDAAIPIPLKGGASRTQKHTPNVRKILQSQKTFANHLDDYQALIALAETNPAAAAALMNAGAPPKPAAAAATSSTSARNSNSPAPTSSSGGGGKGDSATPAPTSKRSAAMAKRAALATANEKKEKEAAAKKAAAAAKAKAKADAEAAEAEAAKKSADEDVEMTDAPGDSTATEGGEAGTPGPSQPGSEPARPQVQPTPPPPPPPPQIYPPDGTILPPYKRPPPPKHDGDNDPLLVSYVPRFPTDDELRALLTAPPLNYLEARAVWGEEETRYPQRSFCDVCGYWGRVKCMKCGARACALDCLNAHKEECVTRYGL
ncbi:hypothetical protein V8F20_001557 [Naviculisporaceae sp. PSN 640]